MKTNLHTLWLITGLIIIMIPVNTQAQVDWEKFEFNPLIDDSLPWTVDFLWPVVIHENDIYMMWFSGYSAGAYYQIGYGESADGISWELEEDPVIPSGNIGTWNKDLKPGTVLRIDDTLRMWFSGSSNEFNWGSSIGYATSVDGIEWDKRSKPIMEGDPGTWNEDGIINPKVIYEDDTFKMWFAGWAGDPGLIGYATSADGVVWTKHPDPVLEPEPGSFYDTWVVTGSVIRMNDTLKMWFFGWDETNFRIGYATSDDGIDWTVQNDNEAVLDVGEPEEWDEYAVRDPSVLILDDQYIIWYCNWFSDVRNIGLACYPPCINPGIQSNTLNKEQFINVFPNPCSGVAHIRINVSDQAVVISDLYSISGQKKKSILNEVKVPGIHEIELDITDLPSGIYFIHLKTDDENQTVKLIKY